MRVGDGGATGHALSAKVFRRKFLHVIYYYGRFDQLPAVPLHLKMQ
ncbi:hypothetical protein CFREI_01375 [Corynebacterium freiburgense]|nr:hypothetical protein CFREI_01375 [Corynebacterium freiburgense]